MYTDLNEIAKTAGPDVSKLLTHKRNANVIFKNSCYFINSTLGNHRMDGGLGEKANNWRPVSGLLPVLKKCFWSLMDVIEIKKTWQSSSSYLMFKNKELDQGTTCGRGGGGGGLFYGSIRGTIIHEQVHDYILFDKNNFHKKYTHLDPWTKKIFNTIESNGWIPIISEFDIYDASLKMATSVDIICYDKNDNGKIICIELKTGYCGYFHRFITGSNMSGCLKKMPMSVKNCASIQLISSMLFIIKHHKITNIEGYIIHINEREFNLYPVKNEFIVKYGNKIYNDIYKHRKSVFVSEKKKKMEKKKNNRMRDKGR